MSTFVLAALATGVVPPSLPVGGDESLLGWYELAPGRAALLTPGASGGLRLLDFERPSFDVIEPDGEAYRWRRQVERDVVRIEFERDGERVTGFQWARSGAEPGHARRDDALGYGQPEVHFASGGLELCGVLLLPRGGERLPGAVVLQGAGDSDRDNVWSFTIADGLARRGVAVLLTDKRGCGKSQGDWKAVGFDALAGDALAARACLVARPEVDPARVGLIGLSQGGWVAPLAASQDADVAFAVSVSGACVSVREQLLHEAAADARRAGGEEAASIALELMQLVFEYGRTREGWDEYLAVVESAPPAMAGAFPTRRDDWRWDWYARLLDFDPVPLWKRIRAPSLVVLGEADELDNVPVQESVARLAALGRSGLTWRVYPKSGHAIDDPATGWVRRDFLEDLARWIVERGAH